MALTSCEIINIETHPDVVWNFGSVEITTTENSAKIDAAKPYITIDGVEEEGVDIYLTYWTNGNESNAITVTEFEDKGERIVFTIKELQPDTEYLAYLIIEGQYGGERSDLLHIATQKHIPVAEYTCDCEVDAKGILAYVSIKNPSFTIDGVESPLANVEFKYSSSSADEWTTVEVGTEELANGFRIPAEGEAYLKEKHKYKYTVTLTPEDSTYEAYTASGEFTTKSADLTANIIAPTVAATTQGIDLSCETPVLLVDGVAIPNYATIKYLFCYTDDKGNTTTVDGECADGTMSATVPLGNFKVGKTYSFISRMLINNMFVMDSEVTQYTIPEKEVPAPPVSGDADTTELAGQWYLTEWRGTEPAFDVYLSITTDGVVSLFQRIDSRLWETFYSTVGYEGGVISGIYTDGVAWGTSYYVTIDGDTMTWVDVTDSSDISVYTRCTLPDFTNPDIRVTNSTIERFL